MHTHRSQLHPEGLGGVERPGDSDEDLDKVSHDSLIARVVRIDQRAPGHGSPDAHVIEPGLHRAEAGLDVAQALAVGQVGEGRDRRTGRDTRSHGSCSRPVSDPRSHGTRPAARNPSHARRSFGRYARATPAVRGGAQCAWKLKSILRMMAVNSDWGHWSRRWSTQQPDSSHLQ